MAHTHVTGPTLFAEANGIRYAYRRFGEENRSAAPIHAALSRWPGPFRLPGEEATIPPGTAARKGAILK